MIVHTYRLIDNIHVTRIIGIYFFQCYVYSKICAMIHMHSNMYFLYVCLSPHTNRWQKNRTDTTGPLWNVIVWTLTTWKNIKFFFYDNNTIDRQEFYDIFMFSSFAYIKPSNRASTFDFRVYTSIFLIYIKCI